MNMTHEKVFIAWGGNQALAKAVGEKLLKYQYEGVVGGGHITDMYLGEQIFSQIRQSTQAIILVQQTATNGEYNFNDNMMFEWGYLTSRMQPNKIHVFLIDLLTRNLPSDLMGIWATEVMQEGRSIEELSEDICRIFYANASRPIEMDKMKILHSWEQTKRLIEDYNQEPSCSDIEMAHVLLHSIETCYQYMENEYAEAILTKIVPISKILEHVIHIFKTYLILINSTDHLTKPLDFDVYEELKAFCENNIDFSDKDENLNLWIQFYMVDILTMLNSSIATNIELSEEEKQYYVETSIKNGVDALAILEKIITIYPKEKDYACLFIGYMHGHMRYHCYKEIDQFENAQHHSKIAVDSFKNFYLTYKHFYPGDVYLNDKFAQTYYLDIARHLDYVTDTGEQITIKRTLSSYLSKQQQQVDRQHKVYMKLKEKSEKIFEPK